MIEYEFSNITDLQNDIKQRNGIIYSYDSPAELKLGWRIRNTDEVWTIRISNIKKGYAKKKKIKYVCC